MKCNRVHRIFFQFIYLTSRCDRRMEFWMCSAELTAINSAYKTLATGTAEQDVIWDQSFRGMELNRWVAIDRFTAYFPFYLPVCIRASAILLLLSVTATAVGFPVHRPKKSEHY